MEIILAIIFGVAFGFILQRAGAADPQVITAMLRLRNLHLMRAILLGVGLSSILLFAGMSVGLIAAANLSVKSLYVGVIVGGALLGLGWAVAGFCPGTGVVALGAGRKDAVFFMLGGLVGAGIYTLIYGWLKASFPGLFAELFGGSVTLAATAKYDALLSVNGLLVAAVIGVIFILAAFILPRGVDESSEASSE